jgi:transcriptional regulator with XRE-family HTH domain
MNFAIVAYIKTLYWAIEFSTITTYWQMGRNILAYYKGKYEDKIQTIAYKSDLDDDFPSTGKGSTKEYQKFVLELRNIANELGIDSRTIARYCRFAQKYTQEDLEALSNGDFIMSWSLIAPYINLGAKKLITIYQVADTKAKFKKMIKKLYYSNTKIENILINFDDISKPSDPTPPHSGKSSEVNIDGLNELVKKEEVIIILGNELVRLRNRIKCGLDHQTIIDGIEKIQKEIEKLPKPAKTEKDLTARLKKLYRAGELSALTAYWRIGKAVVTYYEEKNKGKYKEIRKNIPNFTHEDQDELQGFVYRSRIDGTLQLQTSSPLAKELEFFASLFIGDEKQYKGIRARSERKRKREVYKRGIGYGRIYQNYRSFVMELGKFAEKLDMDRGTLGRYCQFAKEYTKEDLEIFSAARFTMSWPLLVEKNLDIVLGRDYYFKSRELMDIFQNVTTRYKYIRAVSKWEKDINPTQHGDDDHFDDDDDLLDRDHSVTHQKISQRKEKKRVKDISPFGDTLDLGWDL